MPTSPQPSSKRISFFLAEDEQQKPKTYVWDVVKNERSKERGARDADGMLHELGQVKWYGPWRCYSFFPEAGTLFEKQCLRDIAAFCEWAHSQRRGSDAAD